MNEIILNDASSLQSWVRLDFANAAEQSAIEAESDIGTELPHVLTATDGKYSKVTLVSSRETGELESAEYTLYGTKSYKFSAISSHEILAVSKNQNILLSPQLYNLANLAIRPDVVWTPILDELQKAA